MSDRIYQWLLRLYPAHFRQAYGAEACQLFRDRSRHETGFFPKLRLWLDLLLDLAVSIPRQYRRFEPAIMSASGAPILHVLESESLHPRAVFFGAILSLAAFGIGAFLVVHGGNHRPLTPLGGAGEDAVSAGLPVPKDPVAMAGAAIENAKLSAADRTQVIQEVIASLRQYYIDPAVAHRMADALLVHEKAGDYDQVTDRSAFADLLTAHLQDVSHDRRLFVEYIWSPKFAGPLLPPLDIRPLLRKAMARNHCTFKEVEILPHNIGYLVFDSFPDPSLCKSTAAAAMAKSNHADAIIFDLRNNRGGSREMVAFLASYLFDHPTHLNDYYYRAGNSTRQSWTLAARGNRLSDKPVYVLTSHATLAGAEEFSYDLKMLKRATLVGEATKGVANITRPLRIGEDFNIFVPAEKAINPISKASWEATGVKPDVKVNAAEALDTARQLAESKLLRR